MSDQHSNTDPDLQLAKQIGKHRTQKQPLSRINDPLIDTLLDYKRQNISAVTTDQSEKADVWNNITSDIESESNKATVTPLFSKNTLRWVAAAVFLMAALLGGLYWQSLQPELIASSQEDINTVELSDGSSVTLRPYSSLLLASSTEKSHEYTLEGEAYFEVVNNQERTFSVNTQKGKVTVLGTQFILSSWGEQMQVYLDKGLLEVTDSKNNNSVKLSSGQSASVSAQKGISVLQSVDTDEYIDWLNHQLIFDQRTARSVVQELEQQFNISIELPQQIAEQTLSGRLSLRNQSVALEDLSTVLGGEFIDKGNSNYTFEEQ